MRIRSWRQSVGSLGRFMLSVVLSGRPDRNDIVCRRVRLPRGDARARPLATIRTCSRSGSPGCSARRAVRCVSLISRLRAARRELRTQQQRVEELADHNWELKESEERAKSFLAAQGDVIVRRDADGRITYVNDAFCALAARPRAELVGTTFTLPVLEQGDHRSIRRTARASTTRRSPPAHGARWIAWREVLVRIRHAARRRDAKRRPRRHRPRAGGARARRRPRPGRRPPTAPSRASWRWSRTRCARRSTASSAWPTCCATPRSRRSRRPTSRR